MMIHKAIESIKKGGMALIYDSDDREGETDIVMPAHAVTPKTVATMRRDAGGLICVAIHPVAAQRIGLPFISDVLRCAGKNGFKTIKSIIEKSGDISYDTRSSFSLWVNHRDTFTGITDIDRALTITEVGKAVHLSMNDGQVDFGREFRTPGHIPLLRAADGLLDERAGQTELSIALAEIADITPAMAICEMLDSETGMALSKKDAKRYADIHDLALLDGREIIGAFNHQFRKT